MTDTEQIYTLALASPTSPDWQYIAAASTTRALVKATVVAQNAGHTENVRELNRVVRERSMTARCDDTDD